MNGTELLTMGAAKSEMSQEFSDMSSGELHEALRQALQLSVDSIMRCGAIVCELESRGETLNPDDIPNLHHFRKIGQGQIVPGLLSRFARRTSLVTKFGNLPLSIQSELADGKRVPMVVTENGRFTTRMREPLSMGGPEIAQVFAPDHIRTEAEQIAIIEARKAEANRPTPTVEVKIQRRPKGLVVNGLFVPVAEIEAKLRLLNDE